MHFEGGTDGFTDGLEAKDIRQDFKISVQQLKGSGGIITGKHVSEEESGEPGVWGTSDSRRPLEHPRGDGDYADGHVGLE